MAIGHARNMIDRGGWMTEPQPHLPLNYKCYKNLLRVFFIYKSFCFMGELLQDIDNNIIWFIHLHNKGENDIKDNQIVFSDKINSSPYWQKDIYNLSMIKNDKLKKLFQDTFRYSNIFFSDDLTGTDFKTAIDFNIRK